MKVHLLKGLTASCNDMLYISTEEYGTRNIDNVTCENCKKTNEYKNAKNKQREAEQMELKKELYDIINDYKNCDNCSNRIGEDHCKLKSALRFDDEGICVDWEAKKAEPKTEPKHGKHYKEGMQTIDKFNAIAGNLEGHVTTEQIVMLFNMVKYIDRMGKKDDVEKEAYKTADYFYRALNGRFLNEEN